jgi:hypothetical protein
LELLIFKQPGETPFFRLLMKLPCPFLASLLGFLLKRVAQSAHSGFLEVHTCSLLKNMDIGRIDLMSLKTKCFTLPWKKLEKFMRMMVEYAPLYGNRFPPWPCLGRERIL